MNVGSAGRNRLRRPDPRRDLIRSPWRTSEHQAVYRHRSTVVEQEAGVAPDGKITLTNTSRGALHLITDTVGYVTG
jgi:hypothetical protein